MMTSLPDFSRLDALVPHIMLPFSDRALSPHTTRIIPLPDLCANVASGSPRADFLFQRCGFVRFLVAGKAFVDLAP